MCAWIFRARLIECEFYFSLSIFWAGGVLFVCFELIESNF